jgi:hypothetical protein
VKWDGGVVYCLQSGPPPPRPAPPPPFLVRLSRGKERRSKGKDGRSERKTVPAPAESIHLHLTLSPPNTTATSPSITNPLLANPPPPFIVHSPSLSLITLFPSVSTQRDIFLLCLAYFPYQWLGNCQPLAYFCLLH